jgi:uncharacterized peroxidase-related enzyme
MARLAPIPQEKASAPLKEIYAAIQKKLGKVPNIFQTLGHSPTTLKNFLAITDAGSSSLSPRLREEIALTVAQVSQCAYCLAAHSAIGAHVGLKNEEIFAARKGEAKDAKTQAILKFTKSVVEQRGHLKDSDVHALHTAGVTDQEIVEIIFAININLFTNYFNHIADTAVDFPPAQEIH